jgi:hypothetical protein
MANPLDWAARAILQINGMSPEEIKQKARQVKRQQPKKPMPKANTKAAKPQVKVNPGPNSSAQGRNLIKEGADKLRKPKPPARPNPGSINPKGQTNAFNAKGQPRDFRNPKVSANRPPTTTPVKHEPPKQLNPKPQRPAAPGQKSLFGDNPSAKPSGQHKAPSVPKPGTATKPKPSAPAAAPKPKVSAGDAAAARAVRAVNASKVLNVGRLGGVATGLGIANAIDDSRLNAAQKAKKYEVVDPARKDRVVNNLLNGGPKAKDAPKPKPNPKSQAKAPSAAQQATDKRDKKKLF